jgi:hypothetical protein
VDAGDLPDLADLRALALGDDQELAYICREVLTVLAHSERLVETVNFNVLDATVDRSGHSVTFQGVLSTNGDRLRFSEDRFREQAAAIAVPMSTEQLDEWHEGRARRVWPMPRPSS